MRDITQDTAPVTLREWECAAVRIKHGNQPPERYFVADYCEDEAQDFTWRDTLIVLTVALAWLAILSVVMAAVG